MDNEQAEKLDKVSKEKYKPPDYSMCDGFGRAVDEELYWRNTGLSSASVARIKEYHRTHPVQADGTRLKDDGGA